MGTRDGRTFTAPRFLAGFMALSAFATIADAIVACVSDDPGPGPGLAPDAASPTSDAFAPSDASGDVATGPCNLDAPWTTPVALNSVNSPENDQRPTLSADELTIYWSSRRALEGQDAGISRLFVASRTDKDTDSFSTATPLAEAINRPQTENVSPSLSNDRKRLFFVAAVKGKPFSLFQAQHGALANTSWSDAILNEIGNPDAGGVEFSPFLTNDGVLYFARTGVPANYNIYRADPDGPSGFKVPVPVGELSSDQDDSDPTLSADSLTIYFSSSRPGSLDIDIWSAKRTSTTTGFGPATREAELSSTGRDAPAWLSPDGCRIYLTSSRPGGQGMLDVFVASKPK